MKKIFTLFLLSVMTLTAIAQQKKVAVYVTGQQTGINKVLGDQLVAAFAKSGKYIAIERTASFLAELGKEQNYQRTGAVDDNELSRLGKQFGVQLVCVADVSDVFGEKYVSARLIDVETAEVVNTSNTTSKLTDMQELLLVTEKLTKDLSSTGTTLERRSKDIELQRMLENGYIQVDYLYATITSYTANDFTQIDWESVYKIVLDCRVGGMTNWRLPSIAEVDLVIRRIRELQSDNNLSQNTQRRLKAINTFSYFLLDNHQAAYIDYVNYPVGYDNKRYVLLLVHDAK